MTRFPPITYSSCYVRTLFLCCLRDLSASILEVIPPMVLRLSSTLECIALSIAVCCRMVSSNSRYRGIRCARTRTRHSPTTREGGTTTDKQFSHQSKTRGFVTSDQTEPRVQSGKRRGQRLPQKRSISSCHTAVQESSKVSAPDMTQQQSRNYFNIRGHVKNTTNAN